MNQQEPFEIKACLQVCDGAPAEQRALQEGVEIEQNAWGQVWRKAGRCATIEEQSPNHFLVEYLTYHMIEVKRGDHVTEQPAFYDLKTRRWHRREDVYRHCLDWCSLGLLPQRVTAN